MRPVRVAVIDSGVHLAHSHIGRMTGGCAVDLDGVHEGPGAAVDRLGHGTAVTAAIQQWAPEAAYFAVQVFADALRTRASTLIRAIDWCAEQRMDLVNLSLGTTNEGHRTALLAAAERARAAGCLLVAAADVDGVPSFPGALPGVLGVTLDWDMPRERCRVDRTGDGIRIVASGYPRPAPGVPPRRNLHGISFAVANVTGFAASALAGIARPPGDLVDIVGDLLAAEAGAARSLQLDPETSG